MRNTCLGRFLPGEWHRQKAILMAWPHRDTDWSEMLHQVQHCFAAIIRAVSRSERVLLVAPSLADVDPSLFGDAFSQVSVVEAPTNDTWARDFGPLQVVDGNGDVTSLDFMFNAWGMKFAADLDNLVTRRLHEAGALSSPLENNLDMVLEGGSVDSDGHGTVMTTSRCLLSPNRNGGWSREDVERELKRRLGARQILWLENGELVGDDTDAHIDTLARFTDEHTIVYSRPDDQDEDSQAQSLRAMEKELRGATDADGKPYRLVPLPVPEPIYDEDGERMPATYANFLILNGQVLVPTYGQAERDRAALETLRPLFPGREVSGVDCRPLIRQHGSLHCVTMQLL